MNSNRSTFFDSKWSPYWFPPENRVTRVDRKKFTHLELTTFTHFCKKVLKKQYLHTVSSITPWILQEELEKGATDISFSRNETSFLCIPPARLWQSMRNVNALSQKKKKKKKTHAHAHCRKIAWESWDAGREYSQFRPHNVGNYDF